MCTLYTNSGLEKLIADCNRLMAKANKLQIIYDIMHQSHALQ